MINALLLSLSVVLSSGRNLLSKGISGAPFGQRPFFCLQGVIFSSGALALFLADPRSLWQISATTFFYACLYALLLLSAQWCYTAALGGGQVSVCATVYAMGFVIPTLSGAVFWSEPLSLPKLFGVLLAFPVILLSGRIRGGGVKGGSRRFLLPLVIAMLSSGGLGVLQKVQQFSPYPGERGGFVLVAFLLAAAVSFLAFLCGRKSKETSFSFKESLFAMGAGACFGGANLLNTLLAGRMESAVFFPVLNVGSIMLSLLLGVIFFKERPTRAHFVVLLLGVLAILLIGL